MVRRHGLRALPHQHDEVENTLRNRLHLSEMRTKTQPVLNHLLFLSRFLKT